MRVIREKDNRNVLYIDHSKLTELVDGRELYTDFNPDTMEVGWTDKKHIPLHFEIQDDGQIISLSEEQLVKRKLRQLNPEEKLVGGKIVGKPLEELIEDGIVELERLKKDYLKQISRVSIEQRQNILPDYKLQNAALELYDDDTLSAIKATIQAFRNEYHRLEDQVRKASTLKKLKSLKPDFPNKIVTESGKSSGD